MQVNTPFGFESTTDDVLAGVDLTGRRALVTGGASGIGTETVRALAAAGAEVIVAVRRMEAARQIMADISNATGNKKIEVRALDLSDQSSIRSFVAHWQGQLHILVNNAGIMALPKLERSPEGWEMQFATNYMGHFALTLGLHGAMAAADGARIVSLSSSGSLFSPVLFDDLHFRFMPYAPFVAYGQSKTACVLLAVEATRRWAHDGIFANALNPGAIATNLQKHTGGLKTPEHLQKSVRQGAATSVLLAASPLLNGIGGHYYENCNQATVVMERPVDFSGGVAPYALDVENAERLWSIASQLLA